jgi:hypothetical protein
MHPDFDIINGFSCPSACIGSLFDVIWLQIGGEREENEKNTLHIDHKWLPIKSSLARITFSG